MNPPNPAPIERAVLLAMPWLFVGLGAAIPALFVATDRSLLVVTVHLVGVTALALTLSLRLAGHAGPDWFGHAGWSPPRRLTASVVTLVVIVTGVAGLVTLATSAALRYAPSLQFLQLLSALDIAWVVAAATIGTSLRWGAGAARLVGGVVGTVCVVSIWNYVRVVGLGPEGDWIVSGSDLLRLVIPTDVAAAALAIGLVVAGVRQGSDTGVIVQASDQS